MAAERILFGDFELDAAGFELRRGAVQVKLELIPMKLLVLLAGSEGRLVQRSEVVGAIWGKDCYLDADSAVNTAIRKLRRALGDDSRSPRFIETVAGQGYRFRGAKAGHTVGADAETLYRRGLHFWNRKTPESYVEAVRLFQQAIDEDPEYALPYVGLAKTWIMFGIHGLQPARDVYPRARVAAAKALELDGGLGEAYVAMGDIAKAYDWDWRGAEACYAKALELDERCGIAHQWYANLLSILERHEEALEHAMKARELEPMAVGPVGFVGFTYLRARRYREALREAESALTLEPASPIANWFLGHALAGAERFAEAAGAFAVAAEQTHGAPMYRSALAYACGRAGERERAREILEQLKAKAGERYVSPVDLAIAHVAMGENETALEQMEAAAEQRVMRITELRMPTFDALAGERMQGIVRRMGLG